MIQGLVQLRAGCFQRFEIDDKAGVRLWFTAHCHFGAERMSMQCAIFVADGLVGELVGGVENEFVK